MGSVLFVTWDGGGNVPPALGIATELARRGHAVRFLGHPSQWEAFTGVGFTAEEFRHARRWSVTEAAGMTAAAMRYAGVFTDRGMGKDLVESVTRTTTDLVVIDSLLFGAMAGAARAGTRYSLLVHTLYSATFKTFVRGPLGLSARLRGFDPAALYRSAEHIIAATLKEIDYGASRRILYTGPVLSAAAVGGGATRGESADNSGDLLVLVSLSTTYISGQADALQRILDAVDGLAVRAVVTTGPAIDPAALTAPLNAEVHRFLPHARVMPTASLVVSHGGHATTMLALAHDLPQLIMPMNPFFDQPVIARALSDRNVGRTLPKNAPVSDIRTTIEHMLTDLDRYRDNAARLGTLVRAQDGAAAAADVLMSDCPSLASSRL
ncbi:glycosyltransferase [Salinibacterium sp. ZJ454]|uniref:glycosyltransferase n=1 Tax=Salinibacterium sp. ZJ454 TaxID=2708339 RepID=UPI00141E0BB0|nr:glycosyltransferase [Salinibacterium sp. ZJ454]